MIDTSALVAALFAEHEHHAIARSRLRHDLRIPALVLAESYSQIRRTFAQPAEVAAAVLAPWTERDHAVLPTTSPALRRVLERAVELDLGGNIHDALVAQVCLSHDVPLVTLDRRQHRIALALGADSTYLLA